MTDTAQFLANVERELLSSQSIGPDICAEFARLSDQFRQPYEPAFRFLGCRPKIVSNRAFTTVSHADRVKSSRLMLLSLGVSGNDPKWSSSRLDALLDAALSVPGGTVGDIFAAFYDLLDENPSELSEPLGNLIKELVIKCFTEHRDCYSTIDWSAIVQRVIHDPTPAKSYLTMLAVPPSAMSPICAVLILRNLVSTRYWSEAVGTFSDDLHNDEGQFLLRKWLTEDGSSKLASDLKSMLY